MEGFRSRIVRIFKGEGRVQCEYQFFLIRVGGILQGERYNIRYVNIEVVVVYRGGMYNREWEIWL